ncbi:major facilitator superfamily domain-containing protein, partial [Tricladium varicosporioides]
RADGGKDAWLFLAGCFIFEALVWGFPFSFGVFQDYYTTHPPFSEHPSGIAAIGTCSTGVMYLFAPISLYILEAWPSVRKLSSIFGLIIVLASLIASSFATKVWHLILTQGILYAIGGSFLYAPTMFYLDEWFIRKKGLAFGIMWAGVGTSGLIFPFLLTFLLNKMGFAITLRVWSLILLILCTPLIYFVRARLPIPHPPLTRQNPSFSFFTTPTFISLQCSNILESLGFFIPAIYLPSYTRSLGLGGTSGQVLLALLNSFSVLGAIALGHLCDTHPVNLVISVSTLGTITSVFLFWGLGTKIGMLVVFAMSYGFFAGGYSAIWAGMMKDVKHVSPKAGMGTLMGLFAAGRGVGSVVSGPVSEMLMKYGPIGGSAAFGYGTKFGALILFTGVSALSGL